MELDKPRMTLIDTNLVVEVLAAANA